MVEHQGVVPPKQPEVARAFWRLLPGRTPEQFSHPRGALDVRDRGLVVPVRLDPVDHLSQGAQGDRGLSQRRQHALDVAHEDAAGADDEHAATLIAPAVVVEQVGSSMQRHHRLAGAWPAGDRHHPLGRGPDREVLLGLDRRHDGVHRPIPRSRELSHQGAFAHDRQVGLDRGVEEFVLERHHGGAGAPQHAAPDHVLGGRRGRLVEDRRRRSPPVDQQRVLLGIAQSDPADVARGRIHLTAQVQAPEHQPLMGGVELRDPLGSLEHHGVTFD